jgi:hypothetical protein
LTTPLAGTKVELAQVDQRRFAVDDERPEERVEERADVRAEHEAAEPPEDLDVPADESEDVKGGYSFRQAWPKKYSG